MSQTEFAYCPALDRLLATGRAAGRKGKRFDNLGAISTRNNLRAIRAALHRVRPEQTLEVGLAFGGSAAVFAAYHQEAGSPPAGQHTALDPFQSSVWDGCGELLLEEAGLRGYVTVRQERSYLALPDLVRAGARFGLIYVDGSHLFEDVFLDLFYTAHLLIPGGMVLFDDATDRHVRKVLRFADTNLGGVLARVPVNDLIPADRWKTWARATAADLLGRRQLAVYQKVRETRGELRPWDAALGRF